MPKRKSGPGRPPIPNPRLNVTVRLTAHERDMAERMALIYTGGSLSRWARFALVHCMPSPEQCDALKITA